MSNTIRNYFLNVRLANAAYQELNADLNREDYIDALEKDDRFSTSTSNQLSPIQLILKNEF